jgi:hypothetical protein
MSRNLKCNSNKINQISNFNFQKAYFGHFSPMKIKFITLVFNIEKLHLLNAAT